MQWAKKINLKAKIQDFLHEELKTFFHKFLVIIFLSELLPIFTLYKVQSSKPRLLFSFHILILLPFTLFLIYEALPKFDCISLAMIALFFLYYLELCRLIKLQLWIWLDWLSFCEGHLCLHTHFFDRSYFIQ